MHLLFLLLLIMGVIALNFTDELTPLVSRFWGINDYMMVIFRLLKISLLLIVFLLFFKLFMTLLLILLLIFVFSCHCLFFLLLAAIKIVFKHYELLIQLISDISIGWCPFIKWRLVFYHFLFLNILKLNMIRNIYCWNFN